MLLGNAMVIARYLIILLVRNTETRSLVARFGMEKKCSLSNDVEVLTVLRAPFVEN